VTSKELLDYVRQDKDSRYWLDYNDHSVLLPCTNDDMIIFEPLAGARIRFYSIREDLSRCIAILFDDQLNELERATSNQRIRVGKNWSECNYMEKWSVISGTIAGH
jgi:hypothetical protein